MVMMFIHTCRRTLILIHIHIKMNTSWKRKRKTRSIYYTLGRHNSE